MEQVKSLFHTLKSFLLHHKALSLVIAAIIILDISLVGVITNLQQQQEANRSVLYPSLTPSLDK